MQVEGSMFGWVAPQVATVRGLAGAIGEFAVRVPELAAAPPERQRLALIGLSARVRAVESSTSRPLWGRAVTCTINQVFRQLTRIWWPGSVRPLARRCSPRDALKGYGVVATSWDEVAERARALEGTVDSWGDDDALEPRPYAAAERFEDVVRRLEAFGGSIYTPRRMNEGSLPSAVWTRVEELETIVAELRWLRGAVNPISWGAAIGRVRGIARVVEDSELSELLDPSFSPERWAEHLGEDPAQDHLIATRPGEGANDEALYIWLERLFSAGLDFELRVELAEALSDDIEQLDPSFYKERRLRKQLRKLINALTADDEDDATTNEDVSRTPRRRRQPPHVDALRPIVSGMRAVFVTNRASQEIKRGLAKHLGLTCDVVINKVRRRQQAAARIRQGRYDLVLMAEGFSSHGDTGSIHSACSDAGVPYILVQKGRLAKICRRMYAARHQLMTLRSAKEVA